MQSTLTSNANWRRGSLSIFCSVLFAAGAHSAKAAKHYVNDNATSGDVYTTATGNDANSGNSNSPYLTIQAAINAATAGDTIMVDAGTYNENVNINKALTLLGAGAGATVVDGSSAGSGLGTFHLPSGSSNIQIGATGQGFHVLGLDGPAGIEKAAIYLQGTQSNITIIDNEIEARGDAALMGEYNASNNNIVIDNNHITGQTFNGANPAGVGSGAQFTLLNVPRQAVVFGGGGGTTNTMNFTFTNNVISATTGGQSITDNSGNPIAPTDQGNMLVTLDLVGTNVISGNTFSGTTVSWYAALRTRGTGYTIEDNLFNGSYLVGMASGSNAVDATLNYWGDVSGPYNATNNPCGVGKAIPTNVSFAPYYTDASLTTTANGASSVMNISQNTSHCSIQAAVDAANATDTIVASAGEFLEQVEIDKDLVLMGQGKGVTTIVGSANMPLYFTTSGNNYPIVYVHDAANVIIKDLTVDGDGKGNTNYRYQGVGYSNAGGMLDNIEVKSVIETPFNGNQHGIGVFADASSGTARTLTIQNSMISDCQKNAISLSGANLTGNVNDNMITGAGAIGTPLPAQNGIQFYGTAGGEIKNNIVKGFWYIPNTWTATGMLLYANVGSIEVDGNDLDSNDAHIYDFNGDALITNNDMKDGNYGVIAYSDGTNVNATISGNAISDVVTGIGIYEGGTSVTATANNNSLTNISDKAIESGAAATLDATCNWYGTTDDASIQALLDGSITYSPFLNDGTDNDVAAGFQPVPGACATPSATVTQDFESGDRNAIRSDCWIIWGFNPNAGSSFSGSYSAQSQQLTNANDSATLVSPYTEFDGTGNITFSHKLSANNGTERVLYVALFDNNGDFVQNLQTYTYRTGNVAQTGDATQVVSGSIPVTFSGVYRIGFYATGSGGSSRVILDDISLPGTNAADASNSDGYGDCAPLGAASPDSLLIVSDASWMKSTVVNIAEADGYPWAGVSSLPNVSTYTLPAEVGQPYTWHSIDSVDGARVLKSGHGVTFFRTTFNLAVDTGVSAHIISRMDDGMEIYINGHMIAREDDRDPENYDGLPHNLVLLQNGDQDNGHNGDLAFDLVNNYRLDSVVVTGENELVIALRNAPFSTDMGGFSFRMELKTGEAYMPQLTGYLVSDIEWEKSTSTTASDDFYIWDGAHTLPAAGTYTLPAALGQPYGWYSTEEVEGSFAIKSGSDVTYHRRRFTIVDSADVDVRLRTTFDDNIMVYINDVLIVADYTADLNNYALAAHDVMFEAGGPITNGNAGGDMFEQVENVDFNNILRKGDNYITVVLRNKTNTDKGGFSLRLDLDKAGSPVIRKSSTADGSETSVAEEALELNFDVYPNPTDGIVYIDLEESASADNEVHVLDLSGKVIFKRALINPETGMMDVDLNHLPSGMYIIRLKSGDKEYLGKRIMKF